MKKIALTVAIVAAFGAAACTKSGTEAVNETNTAVTEMDATDNALADINAATDATAVNAADAALDNAGAAVDNASEAVSNLAETNAQ